MNARHPLEINTHQYILFVIAMLKPTTRKQSEVGKCVQHMYYYSTYSCLIVYCQETKNLYGEAKHLLNNEDN
jgi:hypothetical protein